VSIRELVARRDDLSTFVVHLTRDYGGSSARTNLESIVRDGAILARSGIGQAVSRLREAGLPTESQKCVCFTETPLQHMHLLLGSIEGREVSLEPYGVAITKRIARGNSVNPVWYIDMTVGHDWLTVPLDEMIDDEIESGRFDESRLARLTPYMEQMGTWENSRKEFWWEREWRHHGDFTLPPHYIGLCPSGEIGAFEDLAGSCGRPAHFIDPRWCLEEIIGRLAGFDADEVLLL